MDGPQWRPPMEQPAPTVVFPHSDPVQPKPRRILWKWSLVIVFLLLGYFMWQCGSGLRAGAQLSDDAVRHFHSQLDAEAYGDILRESDTAFQNSGSSDETTKFLAGVHSKLGSSKGFTRAGINVNASTNGTFIRVSYQSTFDQGNAVETFVWRKVGGGLKLVRYEVNSNAFVTR
jgi:hypothetical protein